MSQSTYVLASNNNKKLTELQYKLGHQFHLVNQASLGVSEAEETGLSFVENAIIKARHASEQSGLAAIADDSGLEVDVLNGAPGIYSSRYGGEPGNDKQNCRKLLDALADVGLAERTARFQCVVVLMRHALDPVPIICQGSWEGWILTAPQGENGFGYDPIFYVPTHNQSAAQLSADTKNSISHRARATDQLLAHLS